MPRFLDAIEKGTLYLTNHPEEARELFIAAFLASRGLLAKALPLSEIVLEMKEPVR